MGRAVTANRLKHLQGYLADLPADYPAGAGTVLRHDDLRALVRAAEVSARVVRRWSRKGVHKLGEDLESLAETIKELEKT